jgi:hypothetical protein
MGLPTLNASVLLALQYQFFLRKPEKWVFTLLRPFVGLRALVCRFSQPTPAPNRRSWLPGLWFILKIMKSSCVAHHGTPSPSGLLGLGIPHIPLIRQIKPGPANVPPGPRSVLRQERTKIE